MDIGSLPPSTEGGRTIRAIPRGRAPNDFWTAYQAHVRAWDAMGATTERLERLANAKPSLQADALAEVAEAERDVGSTFDEVARIARSYGASLPAPPGTPLPTT